MTYTYDQALAYEVVRELIISHIADCSVAMADEEARAGVAKYWRIPVAPEAPPTFQWQ